MGVMSSADVIPSTVLTFSYMRNVRYECYHIIHFSPLLERIFVFVIKPIFM